MQMEKLESSNDQNSSPPTRADRTIRYDGISRRHDSCTPADGAINFIGLRNPPESAARVSAAASNIAATPASTSRKLGTSINPRRTMVLHGPVRLGMDALRASLHVRWPGHQRGIHVRLLPDVRLELGPLTLGSRIWSHAILGHARERRVRLVFAPLVSWWRSVSWG
jgi:hypothetical protein